MPNGKAKGSAFERKIAADVAKAAGVSKKRVYRTPLSGGHPYADTGDLVIHPKVLAIFPFCVECKHRKTIKVENLFNRPTKEMIGYCVQAVEAVANNARRKKSKVALHPMVVMQGNRTKTLAIVPEAAAYYLPSLRRAPRLSFSMKKHGLWHVVAWSEVMHALECQRDAAA